MKTDIDGSTQEEKQRFTRAQFNIDAGVDYMCTECGIRAPTDDDPAFEQCRFLRHGIWKMLTRQPEVPKEIKQSYQDMAIFVTAKYHFKTLRKTHEVLWYVDGVYRYGAEEIISQECRIIDPKYTKHDIAEVLGIIQDKTGYHDIEEFDGDAERVNVKNGIICIRTGTLEEHTPDYLSRVQLPVAYDPHVVARRFLKFIRTCHSDPKDVHRIFEMMGACLIRDNRWLTKAWMHLGEGSNGKSRLFDMLGAVLGDANITSHSIHDIEKNRFALASLDGKLANICGDIEENELTKTGNLKKVIAGDVMPAEKKFLADYNFRPFCKLIFSANGLPQTPDESDGFARRFEIVEWNRQFYGQDRDYTIFTIANDETELTGILNIMVAHAVTLLRTKHLKFESSVAEMKAQWKERSNSVERFVKADCVEGPEREIERSRLYSEYVQFCSRMKLTKVSDQKFFQNIKKLGISDMNTRRKGETARLWSGICMRKDIQVEKQASL